MLVGDFFTMLIQDTQTKVQEKNLDFYILYYTYHNINIPFDCKTIGFALKSLGYQKNYVAITLSKMVRNRYLSEPQLGVYVMDQRSFEILESHDPDIAKEIKSKLKYDKTVSCQKSTC